MVRHVLLIVLLSAATLAAGIAMVPGERERWTMLVRDGRNEEALRALELEYRAGRREDDAVVHLYRLYMSFAQIEQATRIMQEFAADHADKPEILAMLARHYTDIQDRPAATRTLERLFKLSPSTQTAQQLLSTYRLDGAFDNEQQLLQDLLRTGIITANDAERLGLMLAARGDLFGAREALARFDELANPERIHGRLVLFDVLVETGDKEAALAKAASWMRFWRKGSIHRSAAGEQPSARLVRRMMNVDEAETRRLICEMQRAESPLTASPSEAQRDPACVSNSPLMDDDPAGASVTQVDPRDRFGRRRR